MVADRISRVRTIISFLLTILLVFILGACNLSNGEVTQESINTTLLPTLTRIAGLPSLTPLGTGGAPTTRPNVGIPTAIPPINRPTGVVVLPPTFFTVPTLAPGNPNLPVNIVILSPASGNVVAGNVQILGSASHPQFLQYQVEYGPDPNGANLWYPATSVQQTPINNNLLGIWNTASIPDGQYQLRLRVFLRDGAIPTTIVGNLRVQNGRPTPAPSATSNIPRPIAAFTQDVANGQVPLTVRFTNQSSGSIDSLTWNFGDGTNSNERNPTHIYNTSGLYTVTLSVNGPGGASNVSRQINVQSPSAPIANFTANVTGGNAPLTVQFTNTSTGNVNTVFWNFSDGTTSNIANPSHTFNTPGNYNVFLTVSGTGGSSFINRQITVIAPPRPSDTPIPPSPTPVVSTVAVPAALFSANPTAGGAPLTVQFTDQSVGTINAHAWDFDGDGITDSNEVSPAYTYTTEGEYTVVLTVSNSAGGDSESTVIFVQAGITSTTTPTATATASQTQTLTPTVEPSPTLVPPTTLFVPVTEGLPDAQTVQFQDQSTGADTYAWDFQSDGIIDSTERDPLFNFPAPGDYVVTLVTTNAGGSTTYSLPVTISEPVVPITLVDTAPIQPNLGVNDLQGRLRGIYDAGITSGRVPTAFSIAGDARLLQGSVLNPFAAVGYTETNAGLQDIITFYAQDPTALGGDFDRSSAAVGEGWVAATLLDTSISPCGGPAPIDCELAAHNPSVMFIAVGYADAVANTDPGAFSASLTEIVNRAINNGTIPILVTTPPRADIDAVLRPINDAIINVATAANIPVVNIWGVLNPLPNGGLDVNSGTLTVAPGGAGDLSGGAVTQFGANAVNLELLRVLDTVRAQIFPEAGGAP